jgi:Txe/YoeB family toxin of Txe-Axe toxin-antitoxin module
VRSIDFDPDAWDDFLYWLGADREMARRITRLIGDIERDPFTGSGTPEPLKGDLSAYWSDASMTSVVSFTRLTTQRSRSSRRGITTASEQRGASPATRRRRVGSQLSH